MMAIQSPKKAGSSPYQPLADINVTPLVDVMLVLLIVFMITAPMLAAGMKVTLPQATTAQPLKPREPVVISIAKEGQLQVNGHDVVAELLVDTVRAHLAGAEDQTIQLRGDQAAPYGSIIAVMDQLARHGLVKIAIVTDGRKLSPGPVAANHGVPEQTVAPPGGAP